jgi:hypothetical protein
VGVADPADHFGRWHRRGHGEHRLRVEFLISVALIAVARHVIQLDYEHTSAGLVAANGLLVLSLAASYVGVKAFAEGGRPRS